MFWDWSVKLDSDRTLTGVPATLTVVENSTVSRRPRGAARAADSGRRSPAPAHQAFGARSAGAKGKERGC
jgi:hypothetical protein